MKARSLVAALIIFALGLLVGRAIPADRLALRTGALPRRPAARRPA
jgi:hypothetical protein